LAPHSERITTDVIVAGDDGQERRKSDLLKPAGLVDVFELGTQLRLKAKRHLDRFRECQRLAARGDGVERRLVGIAGESGCGRRSVRICPPWRLSDGGW
jgi:hypothetical protein